MTLTFANRADPYLGTTYTIGANQVVIDMAAPNPRLNPFVSPFVTYLDLTSGTEHEPSEWEQIGEVLCDMYEVVDRLRAMEKVSH